MRKKVFGIAILFISVSIYSKEVNWLSLTEEAFSAAKEEDKSVFVLITAPSWCYWCVKFENDVLTNNKVKDYLNENFINLKLLDRVNGKVNPELKNFSFRGFPTAAVYNENMEKVREFSTFNPEEFIFIMENLKGKTGS